jgi:hypothetical protein
LLLAFVGEDSMVAIVRGVAAIVLASMLSISAMRADDPPRYRVEIKDGASVAQEMQLPIDPQVRIVAQHAGNGIFGLTVDNMRITCSPNGSIWSSALVDGAFHSHLGLVNGVGGPINAQPMQQALPKGPAGKERRGFLFKFKIGQLDFTQTVEVIPSKPVVAGQNAKRQLDTCRISYLVENKDKQAHEVAVRSNIDILVNNNDGALFASPTTEPGQVLNGVVLEGKKLPAFIQVLERPNVKDPGFAPVMTFNFGSRVEGPNKVVLTQLGALGNAGWDVPAMAAGDSACAIFFDKKTLKPGEKREMVWAYGGGIASNPDNEGKVTLALGGNWEPGKVFTLAALVEDPIVSQTLELELPAGMQRVEGAELQPVPAPNASGYSSVLWKGRVDRPGAFDVKVRSSTGVTQTKTVLVQPIVRPQ